MSISLKAGRPVNNKDKVMNAILNNKEQNVVLNITMTKILHKKLKQLSLDNDLTLKEICIQALEDYLNKTNKING